MTEPKKRKPKSPTTLRQGWIAFARQVIHPQAPIVQRLEMRRAYYAAAAIVLQMLHDITQKYSEDEAIQKLEELHTELEAFVQEVMDEAHKEN